MPYNCAISETPDYLRVDVSGECLPGREVEDSIGVWKKVAEVCREKGLARILAVCDIPGKLPIFAAFEIAAHPETFGWDHRFKLALVQLHQERLEGSLFSETVAFNRGYKLKVFGDEESAVQWLSDT